MNLLATLGSVGLGIKETASYLKNNKKEEDDEDKKKRNKGKLISLIPGIASPVLFFLTNSLSGKMVTFNKYTPVMAALLVGSILVTALTGKKKEA